MLYVTMYYLADGIEPSRLLEVYPRHRAYLDEFAKDGQIRSIGAFRNPGDVGSMAIFRSREAAESFMENDPFVVEGLVGRHELREWEPLEF